MYYTVRTVVKGGENVGHATNSRCRSPRLSGAVVFMWAVLQQGKGGFWVLVVAPASCTSSVKAPNSIHGYRGSWYARAVRRMGHCKWDHNLDNPPDHGVGRRHITVTCFRSLFPAVPLESALGFALLLVLVSSRHP